MNRYNRFIGCGIRAVRLRDEGGLPAPATRLLFSIFLFPFYSHCSHHHPQCIDEQ